MERNGCSSVLYYAQYVQCPLRFCVAGLVIFSFLVVEPQDVGFLPQSGSVLGSEVRPLLRWCSPCSALLHNATPAALGMLFSMPLKCPALAHTLNPPGRFAQAGSEPLTPRSEASDVSGMSAEARSYLERHLANIARGRGGLVPAHVQAQLGASGVGWGGGEHCGWVGGGWLALGAQYGGLNQ